MNKTPCHDCGCPHTTIKRHIEWAGLKFFLAERSCDNCGNSWMALEPLKNLEKEDRASKYMENTTHEEREIDVQTFDPARPTEETSDLIFKLIDEIKDLKIVINNTNKKVKELLAIIDKKVLKNDEKR